MTNKKTVFQLSIKAFAIIMSLYHLYSIIIGRTEPYFYRFTHLTFALLLGFLLLVMKKDAINKTYLLVLVITTLLVYIYFYFNYERLIFLIPGLHALTFWDKVVGIILFFLVLEGTRRYVGLFLSIIALIFLIYVFIGPYLPGIFHHKGAIHDFVFHYLVYTFYGIFSSPIASSSTYIMLFLIFGSFLSISGVGDYFVQLATALAGGTRGGPAKIAVISSALVGTIVGSSTSNVIITGTFTIPLMKKSGFSPEFAAGVETAASTGGAILPPIMGSVAFVMAEILGVSYLQVAKASLVPAIIYFLSILSMVDFYAAKNNLHGLPKDKRPSLSKALKDSYKLFPLFMIIIMLIRGYSPIFAGLSGIASCLLIMMFDNNNHHFFVKVLEALEKSSLTAVQIILACATSGIIIGSISLTGLGGKFTSIILQLTGGIEILVLFFTMVTAIILGMGLMITPVYIMTAILGGPALISIGFKPIAAHLFILYFAILAPLTPPMAITSYVAANIAGGNMGKTALNGLVLASAGFIIPYIFIYHNELLLMENGINSIISIVTAIIGVICFAGGIQGHITRNLNNFERILMTIGSFLVIVPGMFTDFIGIILLCAILFYRREL